MGLNLVYREESDEQMPKMMAEHVGLLARSGAHTRTTPKLVLKLTNKKILIGK